MMAEYRVYQENDFTKGKILQILWSEPAQAKGANTTSSSVSIRLLESHQVMRRFVIAEAFQTHCLCLPILTYGGKGTASPGVNPLDYAIIHTTNRPPKELPGETELVKKPLQVIANNARHKLDRASRVNFAKIYTVEHNMRVLFIGNLTKPALKILESEYKRVHSFSSEWKQRFSFRPGPTQEPNKLVPSDDGPYEEPLPAFLSHPPVLERIQMTPAFHHQCILDVARTLRKAFPKTEQPLGENFLVYYEISWELPDIIKTLPENETIKNLSTITGDTVNAQATSCGEYLFENWKGPGIALLEMAQQVVGPKKGNDWLPWEDVSPKIQVTARKCKPDSTSGGTLAVTAFEVMAEFDDQVQVASVLSWICAAIRTPSPLGISLSEASHEMAFDKKKRKIIRIKPRQLRYAPERESCWHELYINPVIAYGYPIPNRQEGIGLEIRFYHMTALSGAINLTEYGGGLVAEGLTTVLIPEERLESDNAIQWHLERLNDPGEQMSQRVASALTDYPRRYKETNTEALRSQRAFLGWTDSATVSLGMKQSLENQPTASGARIFGDGPRWRIQSAAVGFGVGAAGVSVQGPSIGVQPYVPNSRIAAEEKTIVPDLVRKAARQYVMIYDAEYETAWQIPLANLVLYMIHTLADHDKLQVRKAVAIEGVKTFESASIPFLSGGPDSGEEARDILLQSLELETLHHTRWIPLADTIKEIFHDFWIVRTELAKAYQEAASGKPRMGTPKRILGVDLVELIFREDIFEIKWCKVNQAWSYLAEALGLVFFCNNLGQAILPGRTVCPTWQTVPIKKNYLVACGESVLQVLEKNNTGTTHGRGSRLHDEILWKAKYPLIRRHCDGLVCTHTQALRIRLFNLAPIDQNPRLLEQVTRVRGGAFIFTNDPIFLRAWLKRKRSLGTSDTSTWSFRSSVRDKQSTIFSQETEDACSLRDNASVVSKPYEEKKKELFEGRQSLSNGPRLLKEGAGSPQNAKAEVDSSPAAMNLQESTATTPPANPAKSIAGPTSTSSPTEARNEGKPSLTSDDGLKPAQPNGEKARIVSQPEKQDTPPRPPTAK